MSFYSWIMFIINFKTLCSAVTCDCEKIIVTISLLFVTKDITDIKYVLTAKIEKFATYLIEILYQRTILSQQRHS